MTLLADDEILNKRQPYSFIFMTQVSKNSADTCFRHENVCSLQKHSLNFPKA